MTGSTRLPRPPDSPPPREGMNSWQLAWRELRGNPRGVWGLTLLGLLYMITPLAPVLAPYDPNEPGAGGTGYERLSSASRRGARSGRCGATSEANRAPHSLQNFEPSGASLLHWGQRTAPPSGMRC